MYKRKGIGIASFRSQYIMQDSHMHLHDWELTLKPIVMNSWGVSAVGAHHKGKVGSQVESSLKKRKERPSLS